MVYDVTDCSFLDLGNFPIASVASTYEYILIHIYIYTHINIYIHTV